MANLAHQARSQLGDIAVVFLEQCVDIGRKQAAAAQIVAVGKHHQAQHRRLPLAAIVADEVKATVVNDNRGSNLRVVPFATERTPNGRGCIVLRNA